MNKIVVASAGSGKTNHLVSEAVRLTDARILITTYTNENTQNIRDCLIERFGCVPPNVTVATWYSVLLTHGVRPYQNLVSSVPLPRSTNLIPVMPDWVKRTSKTAVDRYYFTSSGDLYLDRASDFVCLLDDKTRGLVIDRLAGIFTHVFIDELQDLAGYDLVLLEKLFRSDIDVIAVGDPRQATFVTNKGSKNKQFARAEIVDWIEAKQKEGLVTVEALTETWRSNQTICDFADALYPALPKTVSLNIQVTGHDGIFHIRADEAEEYYNTHSPMVLRWDKRANTLGLPAMNIGVVKGRSFNRILIFPTQPMKAYLAKGDLSQAGDLSKFYVAVTRARFSVAFVV